MFIFDRGKMTLLFLETCRDGQVCLCDDRYNEIRSPLYLSYLFFKFEFNRFDSF